MPPKKIKVEDTHDKNFGRGKWIPAFMKVLLIAIGRNIESLTSRNEAHKFTVGGDNSVGTHKLFKLVTGFQHKRYRDYEQEQKDNDGFVLEPNDGEKRKGKQRKLEVEIPTLVDYVTSLVEEARFGGYLTKEKIREKLFAEFNVTCSLKLLGRTLRRLGFKWKKRRAQYISKKYSGDTLARLQKFCKFCYDNTAWDAGDKVYYWSGGMQVAYTDETFFVSGEFTRHSWTAPNQPATADLPSFGRNRIAVPQRCRERNWNAQLERTIGTHNRKFAI